MTLAGLAGRPGVRFDLDDRIVPVPRAEPLHSASHLIVSKAPSGAEFLADPHAGFDRGPGLIEPVELREDVAAGKCGPESGVPACRGSDQPAAQHCRRSGAPPRGARAGEHSWRVWPWRYLWPRDRGPIRPPTVLLWRRLRHRRGLPQADGRSSPTLGPRP